MRARLRATVDTLDSAHQEGPIDSTCSQDTRALSGQLAADVDEHIVDGDSLSRIFWIFGSHSSIVLPTNVPRAIIRLLVGHNGMIRLRGGRIVGERIAESGPVSTSRFLWA